MIVARHRIFLKNFKKRIIPYSNLVLKFEERLSLFLADPGSPVLKDHALVGEKSGYRAFSVTGDIRVVYKIEGDTLRLYDIGSHNQVY